MQVAGPVATLCFLPVFLQVLSIVFACLIRQGSFPFLCSLSLSLSLVCVRECVFVHLCVSPKQAVIWMLYACAGQPIKMDREMDSRF